MTAARDVPPTQPLAAALRELQEETGLQPERLYNLSQVEGFFRHAANEVVLIPVFAAFVGRAATVRLSAEHDQHEMRRPQAARVRVSWPRIRREIGFAMRLVGLGNAGPLEDVLLVSREVGKSEVGEHKPPGSPGRLMLISLPTSRSPGYFSTLIESGNAIR